MNFLNSLFDLLITMDFFSFFNSHLSYWGRVGFVAAAGMIFGSFASLVTYRCGEYRRREMAALNDENKDQNGKTDLGKNIVFSRSKCPSCGVKLKIRNLVPIFSWLFQRGKCSSCKSAISTRYPLIESSFLAIFLLIFLGFNQEMDLRLMLYMLIAGIMIMMCVYDLEYYYIPNMLQYALTVAATMLVVGQGGVPMVLANVKASFLYLACGLVVLAFFYVITKTEAIGEDDMKFFFIAGLMIGVQDIWTFFMLSGAFGIVFGTIWKKVKNDITFPFAPAICVSAFICLISGNFNLSKLVGSALFSQGF